MKGGAAVIIFEEEYERRFGVKPATQTPDAVALNRALKTADDDYRELVAFYLAKEDHFLESHGWSGRMLGAPIINSWRLAKAKTRPRQTSAAGPSYAPDGIPVPGSSCCEACATRIATEYREKLDEHWRVIPISTTWPQPEPPAQADVAP